MVSIIVPVYNVESYLEECIQSIVNQTYKDWECILINDGSTDRSRYICDTWAEKDDRIKVIHQSNQGVSTARNIGIQHAVGEFITFIDSDDWIENDYLYSFIKALQNNHSDLVVSGLIHNYNNGNTKTYRPQISDYFELNSININYFVSLNKMHFLYPPYVKLYKTQLIKEHNINFNPKYSYGEDLLFNYDYLEHVNTITCIDKAYYHYRIIGNNTLSSKLRQNQFETDYEQWQVLQSFYQRKDLWNKEAKELLYQRLWGIVYDGLFLFPKLKSANYQYIQNILSIKEINELASYKEIFPCKTWIKQAVLNRLSILFYLFFKIKSFK